MLDKLALVFSGGGAKGAFGAGAFAGILKTLPSLKWDIVTGTSTGALIAPFAALARTDLQKAVQLGDFYVNARKSDFAKSNVTFWNILKSIWDLPEGLTNLKPLERFLQRILNDATMDDLAASSVATVITAASLQTGKLQLCTQEAYRPKLAEWYKKYSAGRWAQLPDMVAFSEFRAMMVASSSVPFASEPFRLEGNTQQLVDGGVLDKAPLRAAVAAGATAAVIIMMSPPPKAETHQFTNLFRVGFRAIELLEEENVRNDVVALQAASALNQNKPALSAAMAQPAAPAVLSMFEALSPLGPYLKSDARVAVEIIDPVADLGGTMDFDTKVPSGWPLTSTGPQTIGIMQARYNHGLNVATKALQDKNGPLFLILEPFTR